MQNDVKVIDVEGHKIIVCADTDDIRPYMPCVFFLHAKSNIKMVFEHSWQQSEAFNNSEWCNMMSVNLIEMVEMANELLKENEKYLF